MTVQELAERLKAINERAISALENEDNATWQEACALADALNDDLIEIDLMASWSDEFKRYVLKYD